MKLPQEIELWYLIPAIRREFSLQFAKSGMKQKEIASVLGVTEAAVSNYIKSKRATIVNFNDSIINEIRKSIERIKSGSSIEQEIYKITLLCKRERIICSVHRKLENVPEQCDLCYAN